MPGCGAFMYGHSQILSPVAGEVLVSTGEDEGIAIADVDIEAEISRARTYPMDGSDLLRERKLPAAVATGILILGDATSVIKVVGVLLIMLGIYASESKGFPKKTRRSRPIER